jgi:hypothetical protein
VISLASNRFSRSARQIASATAASVLATGLVAGCGDFTMPVARISSVSVAVDGEPGFISIGGFRWEVSLQTVGGVVIKTWEPDRGTAIDVTPGDYRLVVSAVPLSDVISCPVTDANPVIDPKTCHRDEGAPQEACAVALTVAPFTDVALHYTVVDGLTCEEQT